MTTVVETPERTWRDRVRSTAAGAADSGVAVWLIVALTAVWSSLQSDVFATTRNLSNLLGQFVALGLTTVGQTLVILAGAIDLSVGSMAKLAAVLSAGLIDGESGRVLPVAAALLALGAVVGFVNGLVITRLRVSPLIVTLGMFSILHGLALAYTTTPVGSMPPAVTRWFYFDLVFLPLPFLLFAVLAAGAGFVLRRTVFGTQIYAVGGDREIARMAGINADRVTMRVMVTCSMFAALAGMVQAARAGVGTPTAGDGLELASITAAVLGGASLFGGRGRLIGAIGGAVLLSLIDNSLNLLGVSTFYKDVIRGVVIVAAVAIFIRKD